MALTKTPIELSSTPSIVDGGNATAITIDSSENVGIGVAPSAAYKMQVAVATNTVSTGSPATGSIVNISGGTTTVGDGVSLQLGNFSGAKETAWRISAVTTSGNNGDLVFNGYAGGADYPERMRILSTGGITFNGDTAQANALDDYEEGTWTMTLGTSNGDSTIAQTGNTTGSYTKVGNLVTLNIYNAGSNVSAAGSGGPRIGGFPFPIASGNGYYACASFAHTDIFSTTYSAYGAIGNTFAQVTQVGSYAAASFNTGNPRYLMFSITYMTTA